MEASSNRTVDVLVSGGSYAGLALAVALADAIDGLRILVIDAQPERNGAASAPPDPRAFALSLSSQRMLETLGIWAQIARVAQPIASIEISDSELEAGVRPTLLKYANDTHEGDAASFIVPGSALTAALEAAVRRHPAISVLRPLGIVRADRDGPAARAVLSDGSTVEAALVVAAEGRRSPLREAAGIKLVGWSYGQLGIVQTIAHELPHNGLAVQHFLPAGPFAMLPLTGNRSCITWSEQEPSARHILALDDTAFLAEIDKRVGGRLGRLTLEGPRASWPLQMHLARAYVSSRLALIGDTAHAVHPIAGQGLNLALRDVAALAEVVADAVRLGLDPGSADTLRRYERWRRFDATFSTFAFDGLNRLFSSDGMLRRAVRGFGLGLVERIPAVKGLLVSEAAGLTGDLPRLLKGEPV